MSLPETVEEMTGENIVGSVIWLHGLGADGYDFQPIVPQLGLPADLPLRFVFPHAPVQPVTLNGGMSMRSWYDIYSLDRDGPIDEPGIRASAQLLADLVRRENDRGIPTERIVVAGFSQGGAIASHFALRHAESLAGLMALSTYLPMLSTVQAELGELDRPQTTDLSIFMAHGRFDPVLPFQAGESARDMMRALGYTVEWHEYKMPHAVCPAEIVDIGRWLTACYASAARALNE